MGADGIVNVNRAMAMRAGEVLVVGHYLQRHPIEQPLDHFPVAARIELENARPTDVITRAELR
jgi:hypothetical protein